MNLDLIDPTQIVFAIEAALMRGALRNPVEDPIFDDESDLLSPPSSSLLQLLSTVPCHPICFVTALIYVQRAERQGGFVFHPRTFRRSFGAALVLAYKMSEDVNLDSKYVHTVMRLKRSELEALEWSLASAMNFDFSVEEETYRRTMVHLANAHVVRQQLLPQLCPQHVPPPVSVLSA